MENLAIKENLNVCGVEVPNISGGFGANKKAMLAKHIAQIHGKTLKQVNQQINRHRDRFKDNIDVIDMKNSVTASDLLLQNGIINKQTLANSTNIYLISERGYAKLIKLFNDEKSWDLYDQMLDEYFELRDEKNNVEPMNNQPQTSLEVLQVAINQMVEQERRLNQIEEQSKQTDEKVTNMQTYLTQSPDFKKLQRAVNTYARRKEMQQWEVWNLLYQKIEDIHGVSLEQIVKNRHKKMNKEREEQGKKPYAKSTLDKKFNKRKALAEKGLMKEAMEIIAGLQ